ncbi:hypothetical protein BC830DRAFT_56797 [Chytriomyces sp. MP71]|nr:hypothetical protein BC830DRAFT_56797 [Chytriomyces sp. MP71]
MEKLILSDLDFILGHPSAEAFLKVQCKHVGNVKPAVRALARMIMELTLIHRRFRPFRSSLLASASLILADSLQSCRMWNHTDPLLVRILTNLEECLVEAPRQIAEKYRSGKFLGISSHVKAMLNNKAVYLYHSNRIQATHLIESEGDSGVAGLLTPPKDASPHPFRQSWTAAEIHQLRQHAQHIQQQQKQQQYQQQQPQQHSYPNVTRHSLQQHQHLQQQQHHQQQHPQQHQQHQQLTYRQLQQPQPPVPYYSAPPQPAYNSMVAYVQVPPPLVARYQPLLPSGVYHQDMHPHSFVYSRSDSFTSEQTVTLPQPPDMGREPAIPF